LLVVTAALAQDVIYTRTAGSVTGTIKAIDGSAIRYITAEGTQVMEPAVILMAFRANGNVLTFPVDGGAAEIAVFMSEPNPRQTDLIVTTGHQVIEAQVVSASKKEIKYKKTEGKKYKEAKLPRRDIALILYADGKHELGANPAQAAIAIKMTREQINHLNGVASSAIPVSANKGDSSAEPLANGSPASDYVTFPGGPAGFEQFRNKAITKVDEFGRYIALIVDPKTPADKSNATIELAFTLFVNDEVRVEVSNANTGIKNKYKIRDYLKRLKLKGADYQAVEVAFADIGYASDFARAPMVITTG